MSPLFQEMMLQMSFRIDRGQIIPASPKDKNNQVANSPVDFQNMLHEALAKKSEVKISAHAKQRMDERNIKLDSGDMKVLQEAMDVLDKKGSRESLVMYKDYAFIASIRNRTIITSMNGNEVDVVTNIDSTMIIK